MNLLANPHFILKISHAKTFKIMYTRCPYNNIIQKYSLSHKDRLCVVRIFMNQTLVCSTILQKCRHTQVRSVESYWISMINTLAANWPCLAASSFAVRLRFEFQIGHPNQDGTRFWPLSKNDHEVFFIHFSCQHYLQSHQILQNLIFKVIF